jgi:hypothetical protein
VTDATAFRILCLSSRGHLDAKGIPSRIEDEERIARAEGRKELFAAQALFLGVRP